MEDIVFDLKAPEGWKDRSLDRYSEKEQWLPKSELHLDSKYFGAYDLYNPYFMRLYGGITIEWT